jgi:hypothetical protein
MKSIVLAIALVFFLTTSATAAEWARNLKTAPAAGATAPRIVAGNGAHSYYVFIDNTDGTGDDTSYLSVPKGTRVSFWFDENTGQKAHDLTNVVAVDVLVVPGAGACPTIATDLDSFNLLGVSLDGVATTGSTTNDAIYDFEGPGCVKIDITAAPGANDALLTMQVLAR